MTSPTSPNTEWRAIQAVACSARSKSWLIHTLCKRWRPAIRNLSTNSNCTFLICLIQLNFIRSSLPNCRADLMATVSPPNWAPRANMVYTKDALARTEFWSKEMNLHNTQCSKWTHSDNIRTPAFKMVHHHMPIRESVLKSQWLSRQSLCSLNPCHLKWPNSSHSSKLHKPDSHIISQLKTSTLINLNIIKNKKLKQLTVTW